MIKILKITKNMTREEAIKVAIEMHGWLKTDREREALETLIPELVESEDERMLQEIKRYIKEQGDKPTGLPNGTVAVSDMIAWLEKQKELFSPQQLQEHLDMQWEHIKQDMFDATINYDDYGHLIVPVDECDLSYGEKVKVLVMKVYDDEEKQKEYKPSGETNVEPNSKIPREEYLYHLLANSIITFSDYTYLIAKKPFDYECANIPQKDYTPVEQKPAESISQLTVQGKGVYKICPRCKERMVRDNTKVYTSMPPQYGYECPKCGEIEFDTAMYDNPEMEEQKPADLSEMMVHKEPYIAPVPTPMVADEQKPWEWSEEETKVLDSIIDDYEKAAKSFCGYDGKIGLLRAIRDGEYGLSKQEWSEEDEKFFWGLTAYIPNEELKRLGVTRLDILKKFKSLRPQPKPEWSEEDERNIRNLESVLYYDKHLSDETRTELGNFLKSLPNRLKRQPKTEWSEEEYGGRLFDIEHYLDGTLQLSPDRRIACIDFLKSLRSQSHWKPSEEQMEVLKDYADSAIDSQRDIEGNILFSLYDDLEKLM